jgi:hypothetical protein
VFVFFLAVLFFFFSKPMFADTDENWRTGWLSANFFLSHFQTEQGQSVVLPELQEEIGFKFAPWWMVDLTRYAGQSNGSNNLKASVDDVEVKVGYRLGANDEVLQGDSFFQNVYGWLSWKVWSSHIQCNASKFYERDEGLGLGVMRFPLNNALSYWYSFGFYPSVHENFKKDISAFTLRGGGVYPLFPSVELMFGYRWQTLLTDDRRGRAQEQGIVFGLHGKF